MAAARAAPPATGPHGGARASAARRPLRSGAASRGQLLPRPAGPSGAAARRPSEALPDHRPTAASARALASRCAHGSRLAPQPRRPLPAPARPPGASGRCCAVLYAEGRAGALTLKTPADEALYDAVERIGKAPPGGRLDALRSAIATREAGSGGRESLDGAMGRHVLAVCGRGGWEATEEAFIALEACGLRHSRDACNAMIACYGKHGRLKQAAELFEDVRSGRRAVRLLLHQLRAPGPSAPPAPPAPPGPPPPPLAVAAGPASQLADAGGPASSYRAIVLASASARGTALALRYLAEMEGDGHAPGAAEFDAVLECAAAQGDFPSAERVLAQAAARGLGPLELTRAYSVLLAAWADAGHLRRAMRALHALSAARIMAWSPAAWPSPVAYRALIEACVNLAGDTETAVMLLREATLRPCLGSRHRDRYAWRVPAMRPADPPAPGPAPTTSPGATGSSGAGAAASTSGAAASTSSAAAVPEYLDLTCQRLTLCDPDLSVAEARIVLLVFLRDLQDAYRAGLRFDPGGELDSLLIETGFGDSPYDSGAGADVAAAVTAMLEEQIPCRSVPGAGTGGAAGAGALASASFLSDRFRNAMAALGSSGAAGGAGRPPAPSAAPPPARPALHCRPVAHDPGTLAISLAELGPWLMGADLYSPLPAISHNVRRFFREGHHRHAD